MGLRLAVSRALSEESLKSRPITWYAGQLDLGMRVDAVKYSAFIDQIGQAARALFLMNFCAGSRPFSLAEFLKVRAQVMLLTLHL